MEDELTPEEINPYWQIWSRDHYQELHAAGNESRPPIYVKGDTVYLETENSRVYAKGAKAHKHRLDRPDREKIEAVLKRLFWEYGVKVNIPLGLESPDREAYIRPIWADQLQALFPDGEKIRKQEGLLEHLTVDDCLKLYDEEGIIGLVEKVVDIAKKQERGRIATLLDKMLEREAFVDLHIVVDNFKQALKEGK